MQYAQLWQFDDREQCEQWEQCEHSTQWVQR
jgi:hypothetical protein